MPRKKSSKQDAATLELWRSDAYRLLAACFYEPDKEMFAAEDLAGNLAAALKETGASAAKACRTMAARLKKHSQEELLVEYSALFLGPFKVLAVPYGSVYLEPEERKLMGETTVRVGDLYKFAGLAQEEIGPPDHIALELEFMAFLSRKLADPEQAAAEEEAEEGVPPLDSAALRAEFLRDLLAPWIAPFCAAIREHAELDFYKAVADCLESFIEAEKAALL